MWVDIYNNNKKTPKIKKLMNSAAVKLVQIFLEAGGIAHGYSKRIQLTGGVPVNIIKG